MKSFAVVRSIPLNNGGVLSNSAAAVVVSDASIFDSGDVIQIEQEYCQVAAATPSTNTLAIARGYAGTTAASHNDLLPVYLVSNSRTGAEVNVTSVSRIPQAVTQYCGTVQHAYQVGVAIQD